MANRRAKAQSLILVVLIAFTPLLSVLMFAIPLAESNPSITVTVSGQYTYVDFVDSNSRKNRMYFLNGTNERLSPTNTGAGALVSWLVDVDGDSVLEADEDLFRLGRIGGVNSSSLSMARNSGGALYQVMNASNYAQSITYSTNFFRINNTFNLYMATEDVWLHKQYYEIYDGIGAVWYSQNSTCTTNNGVQQKNIGFYDKDAGLTGGTYVESETSNTYRIRDATLSGGSKVATFGFWTDTTAAPDWGGFGDATTLWQLSSTGFNPCTSNVNEVGYLILDVNQAQFNTKSNATREFSASELTVDGDMTEESVDGLSFHIDGFGSTDQISAFTWGASAFTTSHSAYMFLKTNETSLVAAQVSVTGFTNPTTPEIVNYNKGGAVYKAIVFKFDVSTSAQGSGQVDWSAAPPAGNNPVNDFADITNRDDTNKMYADYRYYRTRANASDADGYSTIRNITISYGASINVTVNTAVNPPTVSITDGVGRAKVVFVSNSSSGNQQRIIVDVKFWYNVTEATNGALKLRSCDSSTCVGWTSMQSNYVNIETDVTTASLSLNDDRGNPSVSLTGTWPVTYSGSSLNPPAGNFTSGCLVYRTGSPPVLESTTSMSGSTCSSTITASASVGLRTYFPYMTNYAKSNNLSAVTDTYIVDIITPSLSVNMTTLKWNWKANITVRFTSQYDSSNLPISWFTISRNGTHLGNYTSTPFQPSYSTTQTYTFNITGLKDSTYEITSFSAASTVSVRWQQTVIYYYVGRLTSTNGEATTIYQIDTRTDSVVRNVTVNTPSEAHILTTDNSYLYYVGLDADYSGNSTQRGRVCRLKLPEMNNVVTCLLLGPREIEGTWLEVYDGIVWVAVKNQTTSVPQILRINSSTMTLISRWQYTGVGERFDDILIDTGAGFIYVTADNATSAMVLRITLSTGAESKRNSNFTVPNSGTRQIIKVGGELWILDNESPRSNVTIIRDPATDMVITRKVRMPTSSQASDRWDRIGRYSSTGSGTNHQNDDSRKWFYVNNDATPGRVTRMDLRNGGNSSANLVLTNCGKAFDVDSAFDDIPDKIYVVCYTGTGSRSTVTIVYNSTFTQGAVLVLGSTLYAQGVLVLNTEAGVTYNLSVQVQDFSGGAIGSGAWIIPNGTLAQMAVTSGWANYTGVSNGTYLIRGKWQNSTVSGNGWVKVNASDSVTVTVSGVGLTILIRFSVYDVTLNFYPVTPANISITFGHNSSLKTTTSFSFKVANYSNTPSTIYWQNSNVRLNATDSFTATSDPQTFSYNLRVYSSFVINNRFNDGTTAFTPTSITLTAPNSTALTITSYTITYAQNGTWTITRILYWDDNVKPSSNPTFSPTADSQTTSINSRIYPRDVTVTNVDSTALTPTSVTITFPNSTSKVLTAFTGVPIQNGTSTVTAVTWRGIDVSHNSPTFDATDGNPTIQANGIRDISNHNSGAMVGWNRSATVTVDSQTSTNVTLTFSAGASAIRMVLASVTGNASYAQKNDVNATGWSYSSPDITLDSSSSSKFEFIFPTAAASSGGGGVRIIGDEVTTTTTGQVLPTFIIPSNLATGAALAVIFIVGSVLGYIKIKDFIEPERIWRSKTRKASRKKIKWRKKDIEF